MPINLNELQPKEAIVEIDDKEYTLKPFTLAAQAWAYTEFATKEQSNGLLALSDKLAEMDIATVSKVCYRLLKDKSDFQSEEEFLNKCGNFGNIINFYKALVSTIGLSQPMIDQVSEEYLELKKQQAAGA